MTLAEKTKGRRAYSKFLALPLRVSQMDIPVQFSFACTSFASPYASLSMTVNLDLGHFVTMPGVLKLSVHLDLLFMAC